MKKTIGIDMDGVLADTEALWLTWYERDYGVKFDKSIFTGVREADAFPDKSAVLKYVFTPGFFRNLPVMEGAVAAVKQLSEDFEIYIVSAAMEFPLSLFEKREWLAEHFPFIDWRNIIFCGDKSIIATDYLIDDHCKNLDYCKGMPIMFSAGHNASFNHHTRVNNWKEVLDLMEDQKTYSEALSVK
ncbi:5'(3')-deoxyribonucleotidase [Pedobacter sp. MC2016-24]|uniref:5' nucleotidase, NT5C type n=1 Tax=Pedobacter sp. MC2016-24 TaxID=2780090 RepID=UPI001880EBD2|nr:5'(3')-deoxyribonucleotidase [Pedobacter sp. MC2016-24]MBE9599603.1 5'(3')-deoxyribonucleotidase [Pedobacter sp. MC2016-24]